MGKNSIDSREFNKFKKSKPWGYHPPDVDEAIDEYENALSQLNGVISSKDSEIVKLRTEKDQMEKEFDEKESSLNEEIVYLKNELRDMHLQMASIELPDVSQDAGDAILKSFKEEKSGGFVEQEIRVNEPFEKKQKQLKSKKTHKIQHNTPETKPIESVETQDTGFKILGDNTQLGGSDESGGDDHFKILT